MAAAAKKKQRRRKPVPRLEQFPEPGDVASPDPAPDDVPLLELLAQNRPGLIGLGLSVLQLAGHAAWLTLVIWVQSSGAAERLNTSSPLAWVIVILLGGSLLLTAVSLFVCLFWGLRRTPRAAAIIGLMLSFFVGVLASATVFMQGIRAMENTAG
ncbi:MAG: hypothetical protein ACO3FE_11830 [Planctomycetaceae bacterium]